MSTARPEADPAQHILTRDRNHKAWLDGISRYCGLGQPSVRHPEGVLMDQWTRVWSFVWLYGVTGNGYAKHNYGVRITQRGSLYECLVRGPKGHVSVQGWSWFPYPAEIVTMATLAGFYWAQEETKS